MSESPQTRPQDGAEGSPPQQPPERSIIRLELIIAGMALAISLCALIVSAVETRILSAQQRASVWPYVAVGQSYNNKDFGLRLANNGIGPARITAFSIHINGVAHKDWPSLIDTVLGPDSGINYNVYMTDVINGSVVPSQTELDIFRVPWSDESRRLLEAIRVASLVVCYCSVFDECWVSDMASAGQKKVCPVSSDEQFDG